MCHRALDPGVEEELPWWASRRVGSPGGSAEAEGVGKSIFKEQGILQEGEHTGGPCGSSPEQGLGCCGEGVGRPEGGLGQAIQGLKCCFKDQSLA